MDKNSIIGFVLIGLILVVWLYFVNKNSQVEKIQKDQQTQQDSLKKIAPLDTLHKTVVKPDTVSLRTTEKRDSLKYGILFSKFEKGEDRVIMIETDKYYAEFSTKGGSLIKYEVKDFKTWDGFPAQLLKLEKGGELNLLFTSQDGKAIYTKDLYFSAKYNRWDRVRLTGNHEYKVVYELPVNDSHSSKIVKTFTLRNNSYVFDLSVEFINSNYYLSNFEYQLVWENSLKLTENRSDLEGSHAEAFSSMGGELEVVDASNQDEIYKSDLTGTADWTASRIKYFCVALIADKPKANGTYITGTYSPLPEQGFEKNYTIALKELVKNEKLERNDFKIYLGPVDYNILKSINIGLEKIMRFSLDFLVRPIAQYAILPFFLFIHKFISNWGLVIIIFAVAMKIVLTPFTRYQMKSMKKMSELQPKMTAIREKYKDDQQKQQQMIMKMYKEEKINPMGGCLPLLLQMPILYALFGVFNSTIELRQAYFGLWIHDLSVPDVIFKLPFKVPLFGISDISGLALLMGITMFIQQKMTIKDPKQKAMVYMMPIMLTLLFTTLPAGLNLYYFIFNLLSIAEQYYKTKVKKSPDVSPQLIEPSKTSFKRTSHK